MINVIKQWPWKYSHDNKRITYSRHKNGQSDLALVMRITSHRNNTFSLSFEINKALKEHDECCRLLSNLKRNYSSGANKALEEHHELPPLLKRDYSHPNTILDQWTCFVSDRVIFPELCSQISLVQEYLVIQGDPLRNLLSDLVFNQLEAMDLIDLDYDGEVVYLDKVQSIFSRPFSSLKVNCSFKNMDELMSLHNIRLKPSSPTVTLRFDERMDELKASLPGFTEYQRRSVGFKREIPAQRDAGEVSCTRCSIM